MARINALGKATKDVLLHKRPELMNLIKPDATFWATLVKYNVLLNYQVDDIKGGGHRSDGDQIYALIEYLYKGTTTNYQGFLKTLEETNHGFVVTRLLCQPDTSDPQEETSSGVLTTRYKMLLQKKSPALKKYMNVNNQFWTSLIDNEVLSSLEVEEFTNNSSLSEQVHTLIEFLKTSTNERYRGFLCALSQTGQQDIASEILEEPPDELITDEKKTLLKEKTPELIQRVNPTVYLMAQLFKHNVITNTQRTDIDNDTMLPSEKVNKLLGNLRTMEHYRGLVCSLIEANQEEVVEDVLGENVKTYCEKHSLKGPAIVDKTLHDAVESMAKNYRDTQFQTSLSDFSTESIELKTVYTPLTLIERHIGSNNRTFSTEGRLFEKVTDGSVRVLCVGEAGAGKTTLSKRLTYLWANDQPLPTNVKVVIFVTAEDEGETLVETIRNAVPGKKAYKDSLLQLCENDPESVLIIVEAFDDFQNKKVITEIKRMLKDKAVNVFMTVRQNHPEITTAFENLFNLHIEVKGFSSDEGVHYARRLLQELKCVHNVDDFLCAVKNRPPFDTNPLNLTLAGQLYSEGYLMAEDMATLTEVKLYDMRVHRLVERESKRGKCDDTELKSAEILKVQGLALQKRANNHLRCSEDDLRAFNIRLNSPAMVLLKRFTNCSVKDGKQTFWVWPHSRLLEFDAAMAITNKQNLLHSKWLYWLANRCDLNPVAQLASAILGTKEKYEEVKTLTTATLFFQTKSHCSATDEIQIDNSHGCVQISKLQEMIECSLTPANWVSNMGYLNEKLTIQLPGLRAVCECRGSLLNGNVLLFHHMKETLKVGLLGGSNTEFLRSCQDVLLPAFDRSSIDILHVMVCDLTDWKGKLQLDPSEYENLTEFNIHLELPMKVPKEAAYTQEQWEEHLPNILEEIHPVMLRLYHDGNLLHPTKKIVDIINKKHFLVQPTETAWHLWSSDDTSKMAQRFLQGSTKSVIISYDEIQKEVIIGVNSIKDVLTQEKQDEDFNDIDAPSMCVNVGFPPSVLYHGTQPRDRPEVWRQAILHLLFTWNRVEELHICSMDPEPLRNVLSTSFVEEMNERINFDAEDDGNDTLTFTLRGEDRRLTQKLVPGTTRSIIFTETGNGQCTLDAHCIQDLMHLSFDDRHLMKPDTHIDVGFPRTTKYHGPQPSETPDEWKKAILHILDEFHIHELYVRSMDHELLEKALSEYAVKEFRSRVGFDVFELQDNGFHFTKIVKPGSKKVVIPSSPRYAIVDETVRGEVVIRVSHPGDCLVMQRKHVECTHIKHMTAGFGDYFMENVYGPLYKESPELFHHHINHLLETYRPLNLNILNRMEIPLCDLNLDEKYMKYYNIDSHTCETIDLCMKLDGCDILCIPDTQRYVFTSNSVPSWLRDSCRDKDETDSFYLMITQASDCLMLNTAVTSTCKILNVWCNDDLMQFVNGPAEDEPPEMWLKAISHLLSVYQPEYLYFHLSGVNTGIKEDYIVNLDGDRCYSTHWNAVQDVLSILQNNPGFMKVKTQNCGRSVFVTEALDEEVVVEVSHPIDCLVLQRNHVKCHYVETLEVRFNGRFIRSVNGSAEMTQDETWNPAINHLLETYHPMKLFASFWDLPMHSPYELKLDEEKFSFYTCETHCDDGILNIEIFSRNGDGWERLNIPETKRKAFVKEDVGGVETFLRFTQPSDLLVVQKPLTRSSCEVLHIWCNDDLMQFVNGPAEDEPPEMWHKAISHLLSVYQPEYLYFHLKDVNTGIMEDFTVNLDGDKLYSAYWNGQQDVLNIMRQKTGFQVLKDPASSRSVLIRKADSSDAIIGVSQPSDCLLLHTDHVRCGVGNLYVTFDNLFTNSVNGPSEQQPPDMWQEALNHLLNTFRPTWCYFYNGRQSTGIPDGHSVQLEDGTSYGAYWNEDQSHLSITKQETGFQVLKDPASSRSVFIRKADSSDAYISVSQPSDCLLLHTDHVRCGVGNLSVTFDYQFSNSVN